MRSRYYVVAQEAVRAQLGIDSTASSLIRAWTGFVESCAEGYGWTEHEYENEFRVRDELEQILASPDLAEYPEHGELRANVEVVDRRFRDVVQPGVVRPDRTAWWRAAVLRRGGPDYMEWMAGYGIAVERVGD